MMVRAGRRFRCCPEGRVVQVFQHSANASQSQATDSALPWRQARAGSVKGESCDCGLATWPVDTAQRQQGPEFAVSVVEAFAAAQGVRHAAASTLRALPSSRG